MRISITNRSTCSRRIGLLVAIVAAQSTFAYRAAAQSPARVSESPISAHFLSFRNAAMQGRAVDWLGGNVLGYLPSPLDFDRVSGPARVSRVLDIPPASYDARTVGRLTAVRNQGSSGSCWAFASIGSLEACLLPAETRDYSENNMKNTHGFDYGPNDGGNRDMATAYLARWSGAVSEADDPYNASSTSSPAGKAPIKHIQEVLYLPARTNTTDNAGIKSAVMQYGAVMTYMYWDAARYNGTTNGFYGSVSGSNHAVDIVGWDDSYSLSNFNDPKPAGNGAFLVRNSWGSSWGNGGYFWISYYDAAVGRSLTVFNSAEATDNYAAVYQYDTLGWTSSLGYGANTAWYANVFTASSAQSVAAVSFYTPTPGTSYTVTVYVAPDSGPLNASGPAATQSGTTTYAGFHTVPLQSLVPIASGAKFSVVVKVTAPGSWYPIPAERPISGYSSKATASGGQSYISQDGAAWTDLVTVYANTNVCVKAYTKAAPTGPAVSAVSLSPTSVLGGGTATGSITLTSPAPAGGQSVSLSSSSGSASVPSSIVIPADQLSGSFRITTSPVSQDTAASITATFDGVAKSAALTVTAPVPTDLSVSPGSVMGGASSTGTLTLSGPAPPGGLAVALSSSSAAARVSASVLVPASATVATFAVSTTPVGSATTASITATVGTTSKSADLSIAPLSLVGVALSPTSVSGGDDTTGYLILSDPAPVGGLQIAVSCSSAAATVPATVTVPSGTDFVRFKINTTSVAEAVTAAISATFNGITKSVNLTVTPTAILRVTLSPSSVPGGGPTTGTVSLSGPAPSGGLAVALSSNSASAGVPGSVQVAASARTATFSVTTSPVGSSTVASITATLGSSSQSADLTILPATLVAVSFSPSTVPGGNATTGYIDLSGPAPTGGILVSVSSNLAAASVPQTVLIPEGVTWVRFTITTTTVADTSTATITATAGGVTKSADLAISPVALIGVSLSPASVYGGDPTTGYVDLAGPAPAGGIVVSVSSNLAEASVPQTVLIPEGATWTRFRITTSPVSQTASATITATRLGVTKSVNLTLMAR